MSATAICSICTGDINHPIHNPNRSDFDHAFQMAIPADPPPEQPAPEGERRSGTITQLDGSVATFWPPLEGDEWHVGGDADADCSHSDKPWTLSTNNPSDVKCDYDYIASASTHKHAKQIVRDHARAALVPGLVEALREVREACNHRSLEMVGQQVLTKIAVIDAALAAVAKERAG